MALCTRPYLCTWPYHVPWPYLIWPGPKKFACFWVRRITLGLYLNLKALQGTTSGGRGVSFPVPAGFDLRWSIKWLKKIAAMLALKPINVLRLFCFLLVLNCVIFYNGLRHTSEGKGCREHLVWVLISLVFLLCWLVFAEHLFENGCDIPFRSKQCSMSTQPKSSTWREERLSTPMGPCECTSLPSSLPPSPRMRC